MFAPAIRSSCTIIACPLQLAQYSAVAPFCIEKTLLSYKGSHLYYRSACCKPLPASRVSCMPYVILLSKEKYAFYTCMNVGMMDMS